MFCGKCGNKLPDNAKFCPKCGNMISAPEPVQEVADSVTNAAETVRENAAPVVGMAATAVEAAEPVIDAPAPSPEITEQVQNTVEAVEETAQQTAETAVETAQQTAETAVETAQQTADTAAETAQQTAETAAETAQQTAKTAVETAQQTADTAVETAQQTAETAVETAQQTAETAVETVQQTADQPDFNKRPVQNQPTDIKSNPASYEYPTVQPEETSAQAHVPDTAEPVIPEQPTAVPPAEAAPTEFAPVSENTAETSVPPKKKKKKTGLIIGASAAAVVIGGAAVGYFGFHDEITKLVMGKTGYAKMITGSAVSGALNTAETIGYDSKGAVIGFISGNSGNSEASGFDSFDSYTSAAAAPLKIIKSASSSIPEGTSLNTVIDIDINAGTAITSMQQEGIKELTDLISEFSYVFSAANGDTDKMGFGISDSSGNIGSVELYTASDGRTVIAFPGVSDKTLEISAEQSQSIFGSDQKKVKPLENSEIKRLMLEIAEIFYSEYDNAEINFAGTATMSGALAGADTSVDITVSGKTVEITLTPDQLRSIMDKISEHLANDTYLINYFSSSFGISESDYKKLFENKISGDLPTVTITHIVDVHNKVLASSVKASSSGSSNEVSAAFIGNDDKSYMSAAITGSGGNSETLEFAETKSGKKNGKAVIRAARSGSSSFEFKLDLSYSDFDIQDWLGYKVPVGSFELKLSDPEAFADLLKKNISDSDSSNAKMIDELKKLSLTSVLTLENGTYNCNLSVSAGDIGSAELNVSSVSGTDTATLPDTSSSIRSDDPSGSEAMTELSDDAMKWLRELCRRSDFLDSSLGVSIDNAIAQSERQKRFKEHYSAYDTYADYNASENAYKISDEFYDIVRNAVSQRKGTVSGVIKLYFKDGKCDIIDNGGIDFIVPDIDGLDSVYAEIFYDSRVSDSIVGVTTVFTDDKNDLPENLPTIFNYIDGVYDWAEDSRNSYIGDFVTGTAPYLSEGTPETTEIIAQSLSPEELDQTAEDLSYLVEEYLGISGTIGMYKKIPSGNIIAVFDCGEDGRWTPSTAYAENANAGTSILSDKFWSDIKDRLNDASGYNDSLRSLRAGFYFYENRYVGCLVMGNNENEDFDLYGLPTPENFRNGVFDGWYTPGSDETGPGYFADYSGNTIYLGSYCLISGSNLIVSDGMSAGGIEDMPYGEWDIISVNEKDPSEYAGTQPGTEYLDGGYVLVEGGELKFMLNDGSVHSRYIIKFDDEEDDGMYAYIYHDEDAAANDEPVGRLYFVAGGKTAYFANEDSDMIYELRKKGISDNIVIDIPDDFGEVKEDATLSDIAGEWESEFKGNTVTFAISSDGIYGAYSIGASNFMYINPTEGGFDIYADIYGRDKAARIIYSEETNKLLIFDILADESLVFRRTAYPTKAPFYGTWTITDLSGQDEESVSYTYLMISEYFVLAIDSDITDKYIIFANQDDDTDKIFRLFRGNDPASETGLVGEYNADDDTITLTVKNSDGQQNVVTYRRAISDQYR